MKERLGIAIGLLSVVALLIALSLATYRQRDEVADSESRPNRSSYNSGATGTLAFYTLLAESGRDIRRWREPAEKLSLARSSQPRTLLIVGETRRLLESSEVRRYLAWVAEGGTLILVGRELPDGMAEILEAAGLRFEQSGLPLFGAVDPYNESQMTFETPAARPTQPTSIVAGINGVQQSRFAAAVYLTEPNFQSAESVEYVPSVRPALVYLTSNGKGILADIGYGTGKIILLTDPYIISNAGIGLADNAQLATQIALAGSEPVAFDEFHQGFGSGNESFLVYFSGTPLPWIIIQASILLLLLFVSIGKRFTRPLDPPEPARLAKLEYITAMAELQKRTRAFDLALENIVGSLRRRVSRLAAANNSPGTRLDLPAITAIRTKRNAAEIAQILTRSEEIIQGGRSNPGEVLNLVREIRQIERELGLSVRR